MRTARLPIDAAHRAATTSVHGVIAAIARPFVRGGTL